MSAPASLQETLEAALAAHAAGQYAAAIPLLEAVKHRCRPPGRIFVALSEAYGHLGRWDLAVENAEQGLRLTDANQALDQAVASAKLLIAVHGARGDAHARYGEVRDALYRARDARLPPKQADILLRELAASAVLGKDHALADDMLKRFAPGALSATLPTAVLATATVADWARRTGASRCEVTAPRYAEIQTGGLSWEYAVGGTYLTVIPRGEGVAGVDRAVAPGGIVLADSGHLPLGMGNPGYFPCMWFEPFARVIQSWPATAHDVDADVLFLAGTDDMAIGHWIIDIIPRLRFLAWPEFRDYRVAIPDTLGAKHRELLALAGVTGRLITVGFGQRCRFRNLLVVEHPSCNFPTPEPTAFLAHLLRAPGDAPARGSRVFIDRSMPTRRIANRNDVLALLRRYGFEIIDLARLSIAEQRRHLSRAEVAICTYGSDSLAQLMVPPGGDFIELNFTERDSGAGGRCAMTGNVYHEFMCTPADTSALYGYKGSDFTVDTGRLEGLLAGILARKNAEPPPVRIRFAPAGDCDPAFWVKKRSGA